MSKYLVAILSASTISTLVYAHSFYDHDCCSDQDCHPIESCDELHEQPDGSYTWTDDAGRTYRFRSERVRPSKDAHCHVCTVARYGLCAYIQQNS